MQPQVQNFLATQELGVLTILLPGGVPHSATVHYSYDPERNVCYIQTLDTTVKAQPFLSGEIGRGSFVVGVSKQPWVTLQMRGDVRQISEENELTRAYHIHHDKHPGMEQRKGPHTIILEFSPTWWRYSDFAITPTTLITSS